MNKIFVMLVAATLFCGAQASIDFQLHKPSPKGSLSKSKSHKSFFQEKYSDLEDQSDKSSDVYNGELGDDLLGMFYDNISDAQIGQQFLSDETSSVHSSNLDDSSNSAFGEEHEAGYEEITSVAAGDSPEFILPANNNAGKNTDEQSYFPDDSFKLQ